MRPIKNHILAIMLATATSAAVAAPPPIVAKGNGAATACASCHGVDGAGNAQSGYPALAQLSQAYLMKQIADFKSGNRVNATMTPIAKALSAADGEAAARYFAGLIHPKAQSATADPAVLALGEKLALNGAWDRQVPACFKCHGVDGLGVAPTFPRLAGQHAVYTESQLKAWKTGARKNDPQHLMRTVAEKLTDDEIQAVAQYLATHGSQEKKK